MIDYRFQGRLTYIGGGLNVQMSAWPAAGGNWWEPTTGSFTCVAAYQAKGAASLAASYVNLANPGTYDLTLGAAPDFNAATGWAFIYTPNADYLKTGIVPDNNQTWSVLVRATTGITWFFGASWGSGKAVGLAGSGTTNLTAYNGAALSNTITSGTLITVGFAGTTAYRNGTALTGSIPSTTGTNTYDIWIGSLNNVGARYQTGNCTIAAIAIYSTTLDATQVGEITTAMNAL